MALPRRFLLSGVTVTITTGDDDWICYRDDCLNPPPPPAQFDSDRAHSGHPYSPLLVIIFSLLGVAFLFLIYLTISKRFFLSSNGAARRNHANLMEALENFADEGREPETVVHHVWLINTVGLDQSVIDEIAMFKYKKGENMIEGSDCSVCLSEFQDDESLRLLPKCSHAFHVACIDTWLRSHKNCPLCRAPVMSDSSSHPSRNELGPTQETPIENSEAVPEDSEDREVRNNAGLGNSGEGDDAARIVEKNLRYLNGASARVRMLSDLVDYDRKVGEDLQPMRRSVSMDVLSASKLCLTAQISIPEDEGSSRTQSLEPKKNSRKIEKGHKRSGSGIYKRVMKSTSFRGSRDKGSLFKRSYSTSGKYSQSRPSRSHDSIPPR